MTINRIRTQLQRMADRAAAVLPEPPDATPLTDREWREVLERAFASLGLHFRDDVTDEQLWEAVGAFNRDRDQGPILALMQEVPTWPTSP
jgi:hypothetical protein